MDQHELTRDAKRSIATIYKAYSERRNSGMKKQDAAYFDGMATASASIREAVSDDIGELTNAGFLKADIVGGFELTDKGIIFMENLTRDTILGWLSFGAQFIP